MSRDLNNEYQVDDKDLKYKYNFDDYVRKLLLKATKPYLKDSKSTLEIGCFDGSMTRLIASEVDQLSVIEGSSDLIEKAKSNVPNSVVFH
ncbi:MAG: hypothetical protein MJK18_15050, partial [Bdellovibrionales bacterium]|nr:hypothetical protein [Bdellovibrionales bacterium]